MRARLALLASGTRVEWREVVLRNKPAALIEASPKATVPVLVLDNGLVLEQSLDIMEWALERSDPQRWLAGRTATHQALVARCDTEFKHHLDRYKYPNRYQLPDGLAHREQGSAFLATLDERLQQQACLQGDDWAWSDAAIAPFVRQFAHTDPDWFAATPWHALAQWLTAFETSERFRTCMAVTPPWQAGDAAVFFPPHG
jgi:glutathione S-transferase